MKNPKPFPFPICPVYCLNRLFAFIALLFLVSGIRLEARCGAGEALLEVTIIADLNASGDNTYWEVKDSGGSLVTAGASSSSFCLSTGECYTFSIYDNYGNGLSGTPPGSYSVYFDGELIDADIDFGMEKSVDFGGCEEGSSCHFPFVLNGGGIFAAAHAESWYSFTPDVAGRFQISTCGLGNICNTKIWGYDHCDGRVIEASQQGAIFYGDDDCGQQTKVITHLTKGETYFIRIGDAGGDCGNVPIQWELSYLGPVRGCMDRYSCNFNPLATEDDGSCLPAGNQECPGGPDLIVVEEELDASLEVENFLSDETCYIAEGCIKGYGVRQILRFSTHIRNIGSQDYYVGAPPASRAEENELWEWDECHGHWHFEGYAEYRLYDEQGGQLPIGFKNGFCIIDLECSGGGIPTYNCSNQGISAGCGDIYGKDLDCQWVDLTDVPDGNYALVVTVNWDRKADALGREEISYDNNWAQVCFNLTRNASGDAVVTKQDDCGVYTDCKGTVRGSAKKDCEGICNGKRLTGDLNRNKIYDENDVERYVQGLLNGNIASSPCSDISGDGVISLLDPVLLISCILDQTHQHQGSHQHNSCNFPSITVNNPEQYVGFGLGNHNTQLGFVDVSIENPESDLLAFHFQIEGLEIDRIENLHQEPAYRMEIHYNNSGEIVGVSPAESSIPRSQSPQALLRIYYSKLRGSEICIHKVKSAINQNYELVQGILMDDACVPDTGTGAATYCAALSDNSNFEWIERIQFGSIDLTSGNDGGYGDHTSQAITITEGGVYPIALLPGFANTPFHEYWQVWADLNADGDFADTGELVFEANGDSAINGEVSFASCLPVTGITTRMRIAMKWKENARACGTYSFGEVEDFSLNIAAGAPSGQTISFVDIPDQSADSDPFVLNATASSGLPVSFSLVSGPATVWADTVSLDGTPGKVVIKASQKGNRKYSPAPDIIKSFQVKIPMGKDSLNLFPVFPNPSFGKAFVQLYTFAGEGATIVVFNNQGEELQVRQLEHIPPTPIPLNLDGLLNGMYFVYIQIEGRKAFTKKIVLNRLY